VTIPDVCLAVASGGAGRSSPPRGKNYFVFFTRVKVMYLVTVLLSVLLVFTHDKCHIRPTVMSTVIRVF